ncbi:hypothetical protein ACEN40_07325 [Campylobacter bilis]
MKACNTLWGGECFKGTLMSKNTSSSNHALFLKNPLSSNEKF